MVKLRLVVLGLALALPGLPALADEFGNAPTSRLAPADEYFGRAKMSVLGIANTIRDAGKRLEQGGSPRSMLDGPLSLAVDALHDWQSKYPQDHWIPRDLLALEMVYLRGGSRETVALARETAHWLVADFPNCEEARRAQVAVGGRVGGSRYSERPSYAVDGDGEGAWQDRAAVHDDWPPR